MKAGRIVTQWCSVSLLMLLGCATPQGARPSIGILDIKAGERHTCALISTGGVRCWGLNHDGQLGDGTQEDRGSPVDVRGLTTGVKAIAAGWRHTCALMTSGGVKCWGNNHDGQLGDGSEVDRKTPQDVVGLMTTVTALTAGERHTCAVSATGGIKCWGQNHDGQLGDGSRTDRVTPVDIPGLSKGVMAIAAGWRHTCALMTFGGVKCWGNNHDGQLGDGTWQDRLAPTDVPNLTSGVIAIAGRWRQTCALFDTGGVKCWGANHDGQLGDGSRTDRGAPIDVSGLRNGMKGVSVGWRHACALETPGGVKCWGSNHEGQLGDRTGIDRPSPVDVVGIPAEITAIAAGGHHTCAMTPQTIACWGENEDGQLGDGSFKGSLAAKQEVGF
jgi:alpha-tubulin suppressor-like RCC1 family protein